MLFCTCTDRHFLHRFESNDARSGPHSTSIKCTPPSLYTPLHPSTIPCHNSVAAASIELLNLFVLLTPLSIVLDIIRLATYPKPHPQGFVASAVIVALILATKAGGTAFAWSVRTAGRAYV